MWVPDNWVSRELVWTLSSNNGVSFDSEPISSALQMNLFKFPILSLFVNFVCSHWLPSPSVSSWIFFPRTKFVSFFIVSQIVCLFCIPFPTFCACTASFWMTSLKQWHRQAHSCKLQFQMNTRNWLDFVPAPCWHCIPVAERTESPNSLFPGNDFTFFARICCRHCASFLKFWFRTKILAMRNYKCRQSFIQNWSLPPPFKVGPPTSTLGLSQENLSGKPLCTQRYTVRKTVIRGVLAGKPRCWKKCHTPMIELARRLCTAKVAGKISCWCMVFLCHKLTKNCLNVAVLN